MIKYFIYCRKSSEAKDRQALSIEAQKRELKEYAEKNGLRIIDTFEEAQSAYRLGRPIFDKMMRLCEDGVATGILTWKADRLSRNALDGGRIIQALDDKILLEIRTPYEIFRQEDNRMMLYLLFGMSNDFSRQISTNVKRGNREKYARGEFLGRAPIGYLNKTVGNSKNIIPDPLKAPIVQKLFNDYSTGNFSLFALLAEAKHIGLTSVSGNQLHRSEIYRMLRNSTYYGVFRHAGEYHKGSYDPLISKALFDSVQSVLDGKGAPRKQIWTHTYKGLFKCANCGCAITAETKRKFYKRTGRKAEYTYYRCTRRKGACSEPGVTEQEMEEMIFDNISRISIDREVWELGIKLLKARNADEFELQRNIRIQLVGELTKVDKYLEKLLSLRLNEEISSEEYQQQKMNLLERQAELREKTSDSENSSSEWLERAEKFFETAFHARRVMEGADATAKRNLIKTVGWNLILKDKKVIFSFKKPYDVLLKPEIQSNVYPWRDSNPQPNR
jgi:site-specific DNA recombinase